MNTKSSYVVISEWMLDLDLSSKELMVYALIHGVCSHNPAYYGSLEHTAKWARCCKDTAMVTLASLVEKGLLEKKERYDGTRKACFYSLAKTRDEPDVEEPPPEEENPPGDAGEMPIPPEESPPEPIGEIPTAIRKIRTAIRKIPMAPYGKPGCTLLETDLDPHTRSTAAAVGGFVDQNLDFAQAYSSIVEKWNETPLLGRERKTIVFNLTIPDQEAVRKALSLYSLVEIRNAIDNYIYMFERPDIFRAKLTYGNVFNFLNKALPTFAEDVTFRNNYYKQPESKK